MTVLPLVHPGQRCGTCRHMGATGLTGNRWDQYVCLARTIPNGSPNGLPVVPEAGTECRYWRPKVGRKP